MERREGFGINLGDVNDRCWGCIFCVWGENPPQISHLSNRVDAGASTENRNPEAGADRTEGETALFQTHCTSGASETSK